MRTTIPQQHCHDKTDHPAHTHGWVLGVRGVERCPGRPSPSDPFRRSDDPQDPFRRTSTDPFAGIDENTESDARRPAVS